MEPNGVIEKKEIKTSIGRVVIVLLFLIGTIASVVTGYNNIINKLNNQAEVIKFIRTDKETQALTNESLRLENRTLEKRLTRIETLMKIEVPEK